MSTRRVGTRLEHGDYEIDDPDGQSLEGELDGADLEAGDD